LGLLSPKLSRFVKLLLQAKARPEMKKWPENLNTLRPQLLTVAAAKKSIAGTRLLLQAQANVDGLDAENRVLKIILLVRSITRSCSNRRLFIGQ
jgi:hypothetical protein